MTEDISRCCHEFLITGVGTDYRSKTGLCEFELVSSIGLLSGACRGFLSHVVVCQVFWGDMWLQMYDGAVERLSVQGGDWTVAGKTKWP